MNNYLLNLFRKIGISDIQNIKVISRESVESYRSVLIVEAERIGNKKSIKIIIDVSENVPTWEQYIDVTYDRGRNTDIKIIIFGRELEDGLRKLPAGNEMEIKYLVLKNNKCGIATYLIGGIDAHVGSPIKLFSDYKIYSSPKDVEFNTGEQLPAKRKVQEAEFWVGYYFWNWRGEGGILTLDNIVNGWEPGYSLSHNLEIKALWNDKGLYINLVGVLGSEIIQWIWQNRKEKLERKYPIVSTNLKFQENRPCTISIMIFEITMSQLINMNWHNKWEYGTEVYYKILRYRNLVNEIIGEYDEINKST